MAYDKNPCIEASFIRPTSIQALFVDFKHHTGPQWPWYEATVVDARDLVQPLKERVYEKNPCIEASFICPTSIQVLFVDFKHHTGPQWPWYEATIVEARDLVQPVKAMVYDKNPCIEASFICPTSIQALFVISNTTLGPSGHGMKPPSSRLGTLYSHWRQWFMTKIHVLRLVSFVRRQFKRCLWFQTPHWAPVAMVWSHHRRG